jgi:hypothetical protein
VASDTCDFEQPAWVAILTFKVNQRMRPWTARLMVIGLDLGLPSKMVKLSGVCISDQQTFEGTILTWELIDGQ